MLHGHPPRLVRVTRMPDRLTPNEHARSAFDELPSCACQNSELAGHSLTQMYGAAVRCKRLSSVCRLAVLHQCIRPLVGACGAPGHHGYQRAYVLISGQTSSGPFGSPDFACAVKTDP